MSALHQIDVFHRDRAAVAVEHHEDGKPDGSLGRRDGQHQQREHLSDQIAGMILLVAMVGAIVLTLQHRVRVRRQDISEQVARTPAASIDVVKVRSGQGLGSNT